jgi:hypothetical protein
MYAAADSNRKDCSWHERKAIHFRSCLLLRENTELRLFHYHTIPTLERTETIFGVICYKKVAFFAIHENIAVSGVFSNKPSISPQTIWI